jgi:hypothetical protein
MKNGQQHMPDNAWPGDLAPAISKNNFLIIKVNDYLYIVV